MKHFRSWADEMEGVIPGACDDPPTIPTTTAGEHLQKIAKARDAYMEARKNRECTCADFVFQYEGCCCGSERPIIQARNELWLLLNAIETREEKPDSDDKLFSSPSPTA